MPLGVMETVPPLFLQFLTRFLEERVSELFHQNSGVDYIFAEKKLAPVTGKNYQLQSCFRGIE